MTVYVLVLVAGVILLTLWGRGTGPYEDDPYEEDPSPDTVDIGGW